MAKISLTIPDDLFYIIEVAAKIAKIPTEKLIIDKLEAFKLVGPNDRYLLLRGAKREEVEKILGQGHITTPELLIEKIKKFSTFTIEGYEINLTEGELKELDRMATRNKRTREQELEIRIKLVRQMMFNSAPFQRPE